MAYDCVSCLDTLIKAGYNVVDTYRVDSDRTKLQFEKDGCGVAVYTYTGSSTGSMDIIMYCTIYGEDTCTNVAATYDNPFSMYRSVPIDRFMEIVCEYPTKEWIERFHAYDVHNTLEVLDGA